MFKSKTDFEIKSGKKLHIEHTSTAAFASCNIYNEPKLLYYN
jgi:hypothetical protein